MSTLRNQLSRGIYSVPEASRLTRVHPARIRRWLKGYAYKTDSGLVQAAPVVDGDLQSDQPALSFRDLMEVRFIDAYLKHGVKWKVIRIAADHAAQIIETSHPFSTERFKTDGRSIFAEVLRAPGPPDLIDLRDKQYTIFEVVNPHLFEGLEFGADDEVAKWYPEWPNKRVVVDPRASFGQPVIGATGIPTYVLAAAAQAEESDEDVAAAYGVTVEDIEAAVAFELHLAA